MGQDRGQCAGHFTVTRHRSQVVPDCWFRVDHQQPCGWNLQPADHTLCAGLPPHPAEHKPIASCMVTQGLHTLHTSCTHNEPCPLPSAQHPAHATNQELQGQKRMEPLKNEVVPGSYFRLPLQTLWLNHIFSFPSSQPKNNLPVGCYSIQCTARNKENTEEFDKNLCPKTKNRNTKSKVTFKRESFFPTFYSNFSFQLHQCNDSPQRESLGASVATRRKHQTIIYLFLSFVKS